MKCLNCDNTERFSYEESSYNEAVYDKEGNLADVFYKTYSDPKNGLCLNCGSSNIEGKL